jgi:hypothetical protein
LGARKLSVVTVGLGMSGFEGPTVGVSFGLKSPQLPDFINQVPAKASNKRVAASDIKAPRFDF